MEVRRYETAFSQPRNVESDEIGRNLTIENSVVKVYEAFVFGPLKAESGKCSRSVLLWKHKRRGIVDSCRFWFLDSFDNFDDSFNVRFVTSDHVYETMGWAVEKSRKKYAWVFGSSMPKDCIKDAFPIRFPFNSWPGCGHSVMFGKRHQGQEKFGWGSWVQSSWDLAQWGLCCRTFDLHGSQDSHRGETSNIEIVWTDGSHCCWEGGMN